MNKEYFKVVTVSNIGQDVDTDYYRYDYRLDIKAQTVKTNSNVKAFKKFEIIEEDGKFFAVIDVYKKELVAKNSVKLYHFSGLITDKYIHNNHTTAPYEFESIEIIWRIPATKKCK